MVTVIRVTVRSEHIVTSNSIPSRSLLRLYSPRYCLDDSLFWTLLTITSLLSCLSAYMQINKYYGWRHVRPSVRTLVLFNCRGEEDHIWRDGPFGCGDAILIHLTIVSVRLA